MTIDGSFGADRADHTFLREMLYVDTGRVRSYLAQLEQGLPERVQRVEERMRRWTLGAQVMVGRAEAGRQSSSREQQDRTLSDLHFAIFEDVAEQVGFLKDISKDVTRLEEWSSGRLHAALQEGHAIRVTAPTRLTDGEHIIALLKKLAPVQLSTASGNPPEDAEAETAQLFASMVGTESVSQDEPFLNEMEAMVRLLFDTGIWVRCMPCGAEHPEACFSGVLLDRSEYIDPERFAIFSRYGADVREWTVVGTVTRIAQQGPTREIDFDSLASEVTTSQGLLDRNQLESMLSRLLEMCEAQGITEGPRWPSIVITPLAVYRQVVVTPPPSLDEQ
jgi:hypothetical protein